MLSAHTGIIALACLDVINIVIVGLLSLTDGFESFDSLVAHDYTIGVFPFPGSSHTWITQGILEHHDGILLA